MRIVVGNPAAKVLAYEKLLAEGSDHNEPAPTHADDYAIIAYTSGSTGFPKGTCHTHGDLLAIADTYAREILNPKPSDTFAGHPSMAFTYGLGGLLVFPLRFGASVVLDSSRFDPSRWLDAVIREDVTIFFTTPTACRLFLEERLCQSLSTARPIRHVVTAGEPLFEQTFTRWREETGIELLEGCGSTEMLHIWLSQRVGEIQPGCTGRPVRLFEARLLDDRGAEIEEVVAEGRLALRGPTGCRYWRQPELQKRVVISGSTISGDRFRRDSERRYWFVGREDDMIISRGYKVSPIEVEKALLEHPSVCEAAVVGIPDDVQGQSVHAFLVASSLAKGSGALDVEVRNFLREEIAAFKTPTKIHFVSNLPRTPTGKISRMALRDENRESLGPLDG